LLKIFGSDKIKLGSNFIFMEQIDVVNDNDEIIGTANHDDIYTRSFNRRIVHVLIFNSKGELALQLRAKTKKYLPGYWSTSIGGHVQAGEDCLDAAKREMEEEIGISKKIDFLWKDTFNASEGNYIKFLYTYKLIFDGPFKINPEEVEKMEFFSLDKIRRMIKDSGKFHPELIFLLKKHYNL